MVARMLEGDRVAFDAFFESHVPALYRFASARLGNNPEQTREVVQSTLCKGLESLASYRGEATLFSWLCGICRFEIYARYREKRRERVALVEEVPEIRAALETLRAEYADPHENLQRQEVVRLVHLTLDYLPPRYGRTLEWKYCDDLSVKEIARRLEVGPKAAESLLTRARQAFREAFVAVGAALT